MKARLVFLTAVFALSLTRVLQADSSDLSADVVKLQKAVSKAAKDDQPSRIGPQNIDQYFSAFQNSIERKDYTAAENALQALRSTTFLKEKGIADLFNKIDAAIHEKITTQDAESNRVFESVSAEVRRKVESRAPVSDFDALFAEISSIPISRSSYGYGDNSSISKLTSLRTFVSRWQEYLVQSKEGNSERAENALNELTTIVANVPIVPRSELLALQAETAKLRDSQQSVNNRRNQELVSQMQSLVDQAKVPADLDAFLAELSTRRGSNNYQWQNNTELVRQFVTKWQDYLINLEAGNTTAAREILRGLVNESSTPALYPRSRLLERLNSPVVVTVGTAANALPPHLNLENLETFTASLSSRRESDPGGFSGMLIALVGIQRALKNGDPSPAFRILNGQPIVAPAPYTEDFNKVAHKLLLEAVVDSIKPGDDLRPNEAEALSVYLDRALAHARTTGDWRLASAVLDLRGRLGIPTGQIAADMAGYQRLMSADSFEKAGQYAQAVKCYLSSLRSGGPDIPVQSVGQRLDAIKAAHPKEFELGEKLPEPPAVSQSYSRMRPPGI